MTAGTITADPGAPLRHLRRLTDVDCEPCNLDEGRALRSRRELSTALGSDVLHGVLTPGPVEGEGAATESQLGLAPHDRETVSWRD